MIRTLVHNIDDDCIYEIKSKDKINWEVDKVIENPINGKMVVSVKIMIIDNKVILSDFDISRINTQVMIEEMKC